MNFNFIVLGLTRPGIELESIISVADALSTLLLMGFQNWDPGIYFEASLTVMLKRHLFSCHIYDLAQQTVLCLCTLII